MILPTLAMAVGFNEGIILQQIHFWLKVKQSGNSESYAHSFRNGRWWVYNSVEEWREKQFPFWSKNTIQRALTSLREQGVVIVEKLGKDYDRTNWYSIDYQRLNEIVLPVMESKAPGNALPHNGVMEDPKLMQSTTPIRSNRKAQAGRIEKPTLVESLTENPSEKTQKNLHSEIVSLSLLPAPEQIDYSAHIRSLDTIAPGTRYCHDYCIKNISVLRAQESSEVAACYRRNWHKFPESVQDKLLDALPDFLEDNHHHEHTSKNRSTPATACAG